ncbi:MAG: hypothetical protein K2I04_02220 [Muribaculaceae bacterium]|nr:hypothetical protein [Muribaculaceae bacterium]
MGDNRNNNIQNASMMRKPILILLSVLAVALSSCEPESLGFPGKVKFTAEGGTVELSGKEYAIDWHAEDDNLGVYDDYFNEEIGDTVYNHSIPWLWIRYVKGDTKVKITALPNKTGKKRSARVLGLQNYAVPIEKEAYIVVKQDK